MIKFIVRPYIGISVQTFQFVSFEQSKFKLVPLVKLVGFYPFRCGESIYGGTSFDRIAFVSR